MFVHQEENISTACVLHIYIHTYIQIYIHTYICMYIHVCITSFGMS